MNTPLRLLYFALAFSAITASSTFAQRGGGGGGGTTATYDLTDLLGLPNSYY